VVNIFLKFSTFFLQNLRKTQRVKLADISKENLEIEKNLKHKKMKNKRIQNQVKEQVELI
jgi:hypothetical protein